MAKREAKAGGDAEQGAKKGASAKTKASAKAKAGRRKGGGGEAALPSVANHPRAGAQVARAKAWGGLAGFLLVALLSWRAGAPIADTLARALAGGVVVYLATWGCAVIVWRHLVVAELRAVRSHRAAESARRAAAAAAQRADAS
ncbi:MAG TPA: hypothetical protein VFF79_02265 [Conexibacter sp.]|jgi:hypothetical protein|nr:hypothetical protein [Conexibacter sp.]